MQIMEPKTCLRGGDAKPFKKQKPSRVKPSPPPLLRERPNVGHEGLIWGGGYFAKFTNPLPCNLVLNLQPMYLSPNLGQLTHLNICDLGTSTCLVHYDTIKTRSLSSNGQCIILFTSITMFCGTDIIPCSIPGYSPHSDIWYFKVIV